MSVLTAGQQMLVIFLIIITGYACYKAGLIREKSNACLSSLVVNVFNPAIIFSSVLANSSSGTEESVLMIFAVSAGIYLFLIVASRLLTHFTDASADQKHITELMYIFANTGFIGIPVVKALLGADKLIYVAIFILEYNILIYTYGTFRLQKREKEGSAEKAGLKTWLLNRISLLKPLLNIGTLACAATLIVFLSGITLPVPITDGIEYLAGAATPLSLMVIGVTLGIKGELLPLFTSARRYLFCLWNLLLLPIIGTWILKRFPLSEELFQTYMIMLAMPVGNMPLMLVKEYGLDDSECANTIILSTLLSLATIPVMVFLYPYL